MTGQLPQRRHRAGFRHGRAARPVRGYDRGDERQLAAAATGFVPRAGHGHTGTTDPTGQSAVLGGLGINNNPFGPHKGLRVQAVWNCHHDL